MEGMEIVRQQQNNLLKVICLSISFLLFSCQIEPGFEDNISLGSNGWPEKQPIHFQIPQVPETGFYQLNVLIRQDNNYPYYNCFFIAEVKNAQGNNLKKGLAEAIFYDQITGKPKGDGLGDLFNHQYKIFDKIYLKKGESIQINLRQFMRKDTLQGILSLGYALKPIEANGKN